MKMNFRRREFLGSIALGASAKMANASPTERRREAVSIDVGRQLFVDDFLVAEINRCVELGAVQSCEISLMRYLEKLRISAGLLLFTAVLAFGQRTPRPEQVDLTPEEVAGEQNYDQHLRPQFHYTPIQGHIGDATGLIYYRGEYHLFNMYDEWSRKRLAHKRWGHAISTDLIHWEQLPGLLDTQLDNRPGSGSGAVDWNNSSSLRKGPEKTLLIFYTDYKKGTCIAISHDRGRTWVRYGKNPVITGAEGARDPTVFWYQPGNEWRMVRYENKGFAFYGSADLLHWTWLSRVEGYYECPDLFELPVLNTAGERRWVLIDGDGSYVLGEFDGRQFVPQTEKLRVEYGPALYATQTWKRSMEPGRAYQIAWMRYPLSPPLTWNGQMSFPVELTLRSFPDGIRLCREPIDEINNLRVAQQTWKNLVIGAGETTLRELRADLLDIRAQMKPASASDFGLVIHGHAVRYSAADQTLRLDSISAPLKMAERGLRLRILMDRSSIEVFADEGQVTLSEITLENPNQDVTLVARGGGMRVVSLEANRLESIWPRTGAPAQMIHGRAGNTGRNVLIGHGFSHSRNAMVDTVTYVALPIDGLVGVDIVKFR